MSEDLGRAAFYDEAHELLAEVEESLLELENDPGNAEQISRLFRAMHTLKGSGAMFGFDEIARFTHEVETVYDRVRAGALTVTPDLLELTLAAKDHIAALLTAKDTSGLAGRSDELMAQFRARSGQAEVSPPQPAEPDVGGAPQGAGDRQGSRATFWVRYRPAANSFQTGTNPLGLLKELAELGRMWVRYHDEEIPPLESLVPDATYGYWDVLLATECGEDAVRDVFIFVDDDAASIHKIADLSLREADAADVLDLASARIGDSHNRIATAMTELLASRTAFRGTGVTAPTQRKPVQPADKAGQALHSDTIRVDATRLDSLVNLVGELVIVQSRLTQASLNEDLTSVRGIAEELQRLTAEMRDHALGIRMVPIGSLYPTLRRLVRDLASSLGKNIEFSGRGAETELDKNVIDRLKDPLVHILRNSADHGIESPQVRLEAGKPERGTISLNASHESGNVVITIADDGGGVNIERVRQKAVDNGLIAPDAELSAAQVHDLLFQPGFSTAASVSSVSGRGVGMDVVRKNIEALRGAIAIESAQGVGTTMTVRLPLTLAIIDGLMFRVHRDHFIIPLPMIQACQERPGDWPQKKVDVIEVRGELIPCLSLRRMLGIPGRPPAFERIIIAGVDGALVGLAVDAVIGQQQAVIKSLSRLYQNVRWISGTTINGDGGISLILDVPQLVRFAQEHGDQATQQVTAQLS